MNQNPIVEVVAEVVKDRSKDIYDDGLKPATKEGGEILQTMFGFVNHVILYPIKKANMNFKYKLEELNTEIKNKADNINLENMIIPSLNIVGPALENLKYTIDIDELREMYTTLLVSSMDKTKTSDIHPSFPEIIKQLQPDEAKILNFLNDFIRIEKIDIQSYSKDNSGYINTLKNYSYLSSLTIIENKDKINTYLDNLIRLSLIEIPYDLHLTDKKNYDILSKRERIEKLKTEIELEGRVFKVKEGIIELTEFGKDFCKCCIIEEKKSYQTINSL